MKKDDLVILLIGLLLLGGMLITIFFGGEKSRHGVGIFSDGKPVQKISALNKEWLDLGQRHRLTLRV